MSSIKTQEEMKRQANKRRKEAEKWKKRNKVIVSMKDIFKKRPAKNLMEKYVRLYEVEEISSKVQRASKEAESGKSKTNKSKRS